MKKIIATAVVSLLTFAQVQAQVEKVSFGAKIGGSYASVIGDNSSEYEPLTSFIFGIMSEIRFTDKLGFQPELVFSRQGLRSERFDLELKYLNFPLLGKYYVNDNLSLELGPQIGLLASAIADSEAGKYDAKDDVKKFDLAVIGGVGYQLESGLNFGARYSYSFSNFNNFDGVNANNQNVVAYIYVGAFIF